MYNPFGKRKGSKDAATTADQKLIDSVDVWQYRNITGYKVPDDSLLYLVEFLGRCVTNPFVEVEFKLGLVVERSENKRVFLPVAAETPLLPEFNNKVRFQSKVDLEIDRRYTDNIRETVPANKATQRESGEEGSRCISKRRIDDLNFLSPRTAYDFRCSCSVEESCTPPKGVRPLSERQKNRLSYRCYPVQMEITTVFSYETIDGDPPKPVGEPTLSYEVEVEVMKEAHLYEACEKMRRGEPHLVFEIAESLLDNVRYLSRLLAYKSA
eukprot:jgi/Galph1/1685/GphlegSOOS_G391.1